MVDEHEVNVVVAGEGSGAGTGLEEGAGVNRVMRSEVRGAGGGAGAGGGSGSGDDAAREAAAAVRDAAAAARQVQKDRVTSTLERLIAEEGAAAGARPVTEELADGLATRDDDPKRRFWALVSRKHKAIRYTPLLPIKVPT